MDTDKLVKAIQTIVKEEINESLPKLVRAGVKKEMGKVQKENKQLREVIKEIKREIKQGDRQVSNNLAEFNQTQHLDDSMNNQTKHRELSKNKSINEILANTQPLSEYEKNKGNSGDSEFRTMKFDTESTHTLGQKSIADKMGYGDMKPQGNQSNPQGLGVKTGVPGLDKVLNRDNSKLVKAWDKSKSFRPGQ